MELIPGKAEHEDEMLKELSRLAIPHVERSNGLLELLEVNPEKYPSQLSLHIEGDPQSAAVVENIATIAEPRFSKFMEILEETEKNKQEMSRIGELLKGGNNVIIATNHGNLIDIALVEAAIYSMLNKQDYQLKTGIVISKMAAMLGFKINTQIAPCTDVLKLLCSDIFLSYPRSESMKKSRLSKLLPDEIDRHNKSMRKMVRQKLDEGGMLLAIAPSGAKDKMCDSDSKNYLLGPLGVGTTGMIVHPRTYVLPVAIWLDGEVPFMEICDIPRLMNSDQGVHDMMSDISLVLTAGVEGFNFSYSTPKNIGRAALL